MFPDFALQALDEVVANFLANGLERIVPAPNRATLQFQPLEEWDNGVEINGAVLTLDRFIASRGQRQSAESADVSPDRTPKP